MGDNQQGDREDDELQRLAAAVDEACRPTRRATRRPRPLSALRDALAAGSDRLTAVEIIERIRARRGDCGHRPGEAPGNLPEAPGPPEG